MKISKRGGPRIPVSQLEFRWLSSREYEGMRLYELENENEALLNQVADLKNTLGTLYGFLETSPLPYKIVNEKLVEIGELLARETNSYRT